MSGWGLNWFGGGGAATAKKDAPKNAILKLRGTMEMLSKREKYLQTQIDEQDALSRKYVNTNKNAAKAALRRKKALETTLEQNSAQMLTLENQISSIESANIHKQTMDAMKEAGVAMKGIHQNLTVDKVDQTMEDVREQQAISDEIANALTQGVQSQNAVDEDELEEELESLQQEELDNKMLKTGTVPVGDQVQRLPTVVGGDLNKPVEEDDEEEELKRLQAEMAM